MAALRPIPDLSVNLPMRRGGSSSLRSRVMGSKRRVRRESRWGTRRMRWVVFGEEEAEDGPRWSWGGTARGIAGSSVGGGDGGAVAGCAMGGWALAEGWPVERRRLRMFEMPSEADWGFPCPFAASCGMLGTNDLRRYARAVGGSGLAGGDGDESCGGCEVETPRGRPRRKEPKIDARNAGGDSTGELDSILRQVTTTKDGEREEEEVHAAGLVYFFRVSVSPGLGQIKAVLLATKPCTE